jgi:hypothetical protein
MSMSEDIEAINRFMIDQRHNTKEYPSLVGILDSWDKWYLDWSSSIFYSTSDETLAKAKQYKKQVETVYSTYKPIQPGKPTEPVVPIIPDVLKPKSTTQAVTWLAYAAGAIIGGLIILKTVKRVQ